MNTAILNNGDMVITISKEERTLQLQHLNSLEPQTQQEYDEITILFDLVKGVPTKPKLTLIKGGEVVKQGTCGNFYCLEIVQDEKHYLVVGGVKEDMTFVPFEIYIDIKGKAEKVWDFRWRDT